MQPAGDMPQLKAPSLSAAAGVGVRAPPTSELCPLVTGPMVPGGRPLRFGEAVTLVIPGRDGDASHSGTPKRGGCVAYAGGGIGFGGGVTGLSPR